MYLTTKHRTQAANRRETRGNSQTIGRLERTVGEEREYFQTATDYYQQNS